MRLFVNTLRYISDHVPRAQWQGLTKGEQGKRERPGQTCWVEERVASHIESIEYL